tara:strand:+ start:82 stop:813 length:732 start_codon:yes stop_codon:yes gene_type:complete
MIKKVINFVFSGLGIGIVLSIAYGVLVVSLLLPKIFPIITLSIDGLGKVGGYLSGAFSPVIFIWLLVGYKMQAAEISRTRCESLNLEQEKIRNAQPKFDFSGSELSIFDGTIKDTHTTYVTFETKIQNFGSIISDVNVQVLGRYPYGEENKISLHVLYNEEKLIQFRFSGFDIKTLNPPHIYLLFTYKDSLGIQREKSYAGNISIKVSADFNVATRDIYDVSFYEVPEFRGSERYLQFIQGKF